MNSMIRTNKIFYAEVYKQKKSIFTHLNHAFDLLQ